MWPYYPELLSKPVPRYTSYPTAAEFHDGVGAQDYAHALQSVEPATGISLYVHIPFCRSICWYCGCNTGAASNAQRLATYLEALEAELALIARHLGGRGKVKRIAFGGGSPNALSTVEFVRLLDRIFTVFAVGEADISIELDPRAFTTEWARVLAASNVRRVSLGVQTFAPHVQEAIGRIQPRSLIETCVSALRSRAIEAINFDLMYGLPGQSLADLEATIVEAIRFRPARIALFGYAHLPSMIPRQKRIDASTLPDAELRFRQSALGHDLLVAAGYVPIGFDHFALPDDPLAIAAKNGWLRRNFQGFTEDTNNILLGFGSSAISMLPGLLIQSEKNIGRYRSRVGEGSLPAARGFVLDEEDKARAELIRRLLCDGEVRLERNDMQRNAFLPFVERNLATWSGSTLTIESDGRPYARTMASVLDQFRSPTMESGSRPV